MNTKDKAEAQELIESLYKESYRKLISMVARDPVCHALAEDIVQDTFYEAVKNRKKLAQHENPGGWLTLTAQNKMREVRRKFYRRGAYEEDGIEADLKSMEDEYGLLEINMLFDATLTDHEKALFHMFYVEGYSGEELAAMEGITEVNLRVKLHRIREKVRKELEGKKKRSSKRR